MAGADITNEVISHILSDTSSTSVPAGEVWTVQVHSHYLNTTNRGGVSINGQQVAFLYDNQQAIPAWCSFTTVLTGGDTIAGVENGDRNVVQGFRVDTGNRPIDNAPVSVQLGTSESVMVPTGEQWNVSIVVGTINSTRSQLNVNGTAILEVYDNDNIPQMQIIDLVLTGGDTVSLSGSGIGAQIGGWRL